MTSSDIEKGKGDESDGECMTIEEWESTFVAKLRSDSPMHRSCSIFRVPEVLRRQKRVAYQPNIVSIGPYHRGGAQFQLVENVKKWYLSRLLSRQNIHLNSWMVSIRKMEKDARNCYAELPNLDQNDFVEMLILDGWFLIEFLRKAVISENEPQDLDDPIFTVPCMLEYLYHDLLLLENQLPWSVLEFFYGLIENNPTKIPLSKVVIKFFKNSVADPSIFNESADSSRAILHILDLVRTALVKSDSSPPSTTGNWIRRIPCPDLLRKWIQKAKTCTSNSLPVSIPGAATLSEAGVKFKRGKRGCILNIGFKDGVFTIPPLAIDERTGPLFRNLMAYEQCYYGCDHRITSYTVLMSNLINTSKDVDLLSEKKILANWLSAEDVSKSFYELYNDTTVIGYCYHKLCADVYKHHHAPWNKLRAKLKRDYFNTPIGGLIISFFTALVLLVLSFLQTIYTMQTYYHPDPFSN